MFHLCSHVHAQAASPMIAPIRSLADLERHGGSIHAECSQCGRVALFAVSELLGHFRRRKLRMKWPEFAERLRCSPPDGCGAYNPKVTWYSRPPPPEDDPPPPRPRFVRTAAPPGIDPEAWQKARGDRERRRLLRIARS
jgi:hypothetical protein